MNDYLTKPIRETELHAALDRAIAHLENNGSVLAPMQDAPRLNLVRAALPPPLAVNTPDGLSEAELQQQPTG